MTITSLWRRLTRAVQPTHDAHRGLALIEDQADWLRSLRVEAEAEPVTPPPAPAYVRPYAPQPGVITRMGETGRQGRYALAHEVGTPGHAEWIAREVAAWVEALRTEPDVLAALLAAGRLHVEPSWRELVGGAR